MLDVIIQLSDKDHWMGLVCTCRCFQTPERIVPRHRSGQKSEEKQRSHLRLLCVALDQKPEIYSKQGVALWRMEAGLRMPPARQAALHSTTPVQTFWYSDSLASKTLFYAWPTKLTCWWRSWSGSCSMVLYKQCARLTFSALPINKHNQHVTVVSRKEKVGTRHVT